MVGLVEFEEPAASLVRLVEDTAPEEMMDAAVARLRAGVDPAQMLAAAGLAVSRATELPPGHHGGPVHPVSGLYALGQLSARLDAEHALLPALQSVALANKHIHHPDMGPGAMPVLDCAALAGESKDALLRGLAHALSTRLAASAERHLLALLDVASRGEIMEVLLEVALPRNALDDHYFLYPVYAFRALDQIGWQHAATLLRPPVRYLARHPELDIGGEDSHYYEEGIALYENQGALDRRAARSGVDIDSVPLETQRDESDAIAMLADRIGSLERIQDANEPMLEALAHGLSLSAAGEGLSIGGARLFLRSNSGNPFDVHIHTGINARRYLLRLEGLSVRTKALALLSWAHGAEVRYLDETLHWRLEPDAGVLSGAPEGDAELLDAIAESIMRQPQIDVRTSTVGNIAELLAPESNREALALAWRYAQLGHDAEPFFRLMAELVCRDDVSEMHAYKLQQAAYEEYHHTREPHRWVHLVSAAKHVMCVVPIRPQAVYERARDALSV